MKTVQAQQLATSVRQWLRAPDATIDYNNAHSKCHAGTGQWLIQGSNFTRWLQQDNSFLWLYGFAGCGKSVLCSTAIHQALRHVQSSADSAIAFFFFTFNDESKQNVSAALRALLLQLCGQVSGLDVDLARLKDSYREGTPPVPVFLEHLRQAISRRRNVHIFLDALDESPAGSSRDEVLSVIERMRQWQLPGLHLLVTSRDISDIRDQLLSQDGEHISLKNNGVHRDISRYVSSQVDNNGQLRRWGDHTEKIKSYLTEHADGVFRWVECQLRPLQRCARSEKHLEKCLRSLPKSLDETYERILCDMESQEEARQILSLLCYASRPLSVSELIEALAVDIDDLESYDPRSLLTDGADDLLRICPGLIEISLGKHSGINHAFDSIFTEKYGTDSDEDDEEISDTDSDIDIANVQMIRIAHFSVQEYLHSERIRRSSACGFALSEPLHHGRISKICLLYLTYDKFLEQPLRPNLIKRYSFAVYAARYWHYHYHRADRQLAEQLVERVAVFLTARRTRDRWLWLFGCDCEPLRKCDLHYYGSEEDPDPSAICYASSLGLDSVLAYLLSTYKFNVNARRKGWGYTALYEPSLEGHEKVVQMLIDAGANVNAGGGYHGNALRAAVEGGHEKVVQMLINAGADVNAEGGRDNDTALWRAAQGGYEKVVQMLVNAGADVNARRPFYGTALQVASNRGHEKVVQILIHAGADVDLRRGGSYYTALGMASFQDHTKIVEILIDAGANVNARDIFGNIALYSPSYRGNKKMVQMLIDAGADVNVEGRGTYPNALIAASKNGHDKVVKLLLDAGADIGSLDRYRHYWDRPEWDTTDDENDSSD